VNPVARTEFKKATNASCARKFFCHSMNSDTVLRLAACAASSALNPAHRFRWAAGFARDRKDAEDGFNGGGWVCTGWWPGKENGNPA
jgi:hypothetical protein